MLTASFVMIGLLLGSRGEAPREEKFQGVLLAQADAAPLPVNDEAQKRELEDLLRERPSLTGAQITLAVGGGVAVLGGVLIVGGFLAGGFGGVFLALIGIVVGVAGLVVALIGGLVLIGMAAERARVDARIEELRMRQLPPQQPPPAQPPPSVMMENESGLVLARF